MVFAGIYCQEGDDFPHLREAMAKLKLNDEALTFEPEHSTALGFGFRCGFLGLLHLEICQERLKREYGLNLIITVPSVAYRVTLNEAGTQALGRKEKSKRGEIKNELIITSPLDLPDKSQIEKIEEPWMKVDIISPSEYLGPVMRLVEEKGGNYKNTEYLDEARVILHFELPLSSILVDFYDKIKSVTSGYASLNYEILDYRSCQVERLDILVAGEKEESLSSIVYTDSAYPAGRQIVKSLKEVLPRQLFEVKIQAAIGSKIIAAERIPPMRKDVTAKLYGGDVTRKKKLLEKQKKGKKRMKVFGKLDIPQEAFLAILKR
jgi:GTP-binding protein LepA